MRVIGDREATELGALVGALSNDPSAAIGCVTLAHATGLSPSRIAELAARHPSYFVSVAGKSLYALNRFGSFKGSKALILRDIERARRMARDAMIGSFTAIPGTLLISLALSVPGLLSGQMESALFTLVLLAAAILVAAMAVLFLLRLRP
jgi:hypothetical protein